MFEFNKSREPLKLKADTSYLTRSGKVVSDLAYSHTKDGFQIFTGCIGSTAYYWREDGRALTEYGNPLSTLDHDITQE